MRLKINVSDVAAERVKVQLGEKGYTHLGVKRRYRQKYKNSPRTLVYLGQLTKEQVDVVNALLKDLTKPDTKFERTKVAITRIR